jgi:hypothetical protein
MMLNCEYCERPITADQLPLVLEWGKRELGTPVFIGRPIKRAVHLDCDRKQKGQAVVGVCLEAPRPRGATTAAGKEPSEPKRSSLDEQQCIFKIVKSNPRKESTWGWKSFNLVTNGMTVAEYLAAGGRKNDLSWDIDHKFVELRGKNAQPEPPIMERVPEKKSGPKKAESKPPAKHQPQASKKSKQTKPKPKQKGKR